MSYDLKVPPLLKKTQQWFASIIIRPIDVDNKMMALSPQGKPMREEASRYITPSPTLQPHQRIQIYNQQYWWRLLSNMHEMFPILTRLFGYNEFNMKFAFPYLYENPPNHWSLNQIGDRFPNWIRKNYHEADQALVYASVDVDHAFTASFTTMQETILGNDLNEKILKLQPHVFLFEFPFEIFEFRKEFLKEEPDFWVDHDFPVLKHAAENEKFYYFFYRNRNLDLDVAKISEAEYLAIQYFKQPASLDSFCEWLENQPSESIVFQEAETKLHLWLQNWTAHGILSISPCFL